MSVTSPRSETTEETWPTETTQGAEEQETTTLPADLEPLEEEKETKEVLETDVEKTEVEVSNKQQIQIKEDISGNSESTTFPVFNQSLSTHSLSNHTRWKKVLFSGYHAHAFTATGSKHWYR